MTAPKYLTDRGPTTADDPTRLLWYATSCGYWTDDWNTLSKTGGGDIQLLDKNGKPYKLIKDTPGIPCCPVCGCVGMQVEASKWDDGAKTHDAQNPGYLDFLRGNKETCFRKYGGFLKAFKASQPNPPHPEK